MKKLSVGLVAAFFFFAQTPWIPTSDAGDVVFEDYAYVSDLASGTVSVVGLSQTRVIGAPFDVGSKPRGVAISPDGLTVYVANEESETVSVVDTATNTGFQVAVEGSPLCVAASPAGRFVYVTNVSRDVLSVIDTLNDHVISLEIPVGVSPVGVAVSTDGDIDTVYVANRDGDTVSVIDIDLEGQDDEPEVISEVISINVGSKPIGIAVSPYGDAVYVANRNDGTLSYIDVYDIGSYVEKQKTGGDPNASYVPYVEEVGGTPHGVAVSSDGGTDTVFVANTGDDTVSVVEAYRDSDNNLVASEVRTVSVGTKPYGIATSSDGTFVCVTSYETNELGLSGIVTIIDTSNNYWRRFLALNEIGESAPASFGQFIGSVPGPEPVESFDADAHSASEIGLVWTYDGTRVTEFGIERSLDENGPWVQVATVDAEVDVFTYTYTDSGRNEGTTYYYQIQAINAVGGSEYTVARAKTLAAAPTDLTATAISTNRIDISWTDNSFGEAEFIIQRKPASGTANEYKTIGIVPSDVKSFSDRFHLRDFSSYSYRVYAAVDSGFDLDAFDDTGEDIAFSNEVSATTRLAAPSALSATAYYSKHIDLSWKDNSGAEAGFKIEKKKISEDEDDEASSDDESGSASKAAYSVIAEVGANVTAYRDKDVQTGETYSYRVMAFNGTEESAYSNEAKEDTSSSLCFISTASCGYADIHVGNAMTAACLAFLMVMSLGVISVFAQQPKCTRP